ncbi:CBO0543 family protein [Robertmurraya andreesenii]|uniref:Uncharacterized protein n=1 Tax=Anoxybacillus andreesenii TaxID=1325932 RepID=A0ABT9V1I6_9BACL|nr:CBO0543 family protein [Robertmurraya andreesenii]MDQ0154771.1 hypothetical protein [Robertmurraya andreesenii]
MVNVIYALVWLIAPMIWGDWRNWQKYYSTIMFFIMGDLLYLYLLSDHFPMWKYNPHEIDDNLGLTNSHISLSIILIKYPATVLLYLSNFPKKGRFKQFGYYLLWVGIYGINEIIDLKLNLIQYHNGWSFWWSMFFNMILFYFLWVHYRNPILAWLFSFVYIAFLWVVFDVPSTVFR